MHSTSTLALAGPLALAAALAVPAAAAAQQILPTITTIARADSLHSEGDRLAYTTHRWRDAASLHRQSAALRAPEDTMGYRCLTAAAQISFAAKDLGSAQRDMIAAAAQAIARGDVENAAHAYANAAWVAKERQRSNEVWELGRQAEVLASSPLLSSAQRNTIYKRFVRSDRQYAVVR